MTRHYNGLVVPSMAFILWLTAVYWMLSGLG
jgi:hypothetical protein